MPKLKSHEVEVRVSVHPTLMREYAVWVEVYGSAGDHAGIIIMRDPSEEAARAFAKSVVLKKGE